jgi:hypothetical protein
MRAWCALQGLISVTSIEAWEVARTPAAPDRLRMLARAAREPARAPAQGRSIARAFTVRLIKGGAGMDSSMIKGIVIGGIAMVVVAAGAVPTYKALTKPKVADVIGVQEVTETVVTPREECHDVQVTKQAPTQDPNRVTGTVIGGVAGGLLGSSIGSGSGRTAATIVGAAGGAYV